MLSKLVFSEISFVCGRKIIDNPCGTNTEISILGVRYSLCRTRLSIVLDGKSCLSPCCGRKILPWSSDFFLYSTVVVDSIIPLSSHFWLRMRVAGFNGARCQFNRCGQYIISITMIVINVCVCTNLCIGICMLDVRLFFAKFLVLHRKN